MDEGREQGVGLGRGEVALHNKPYPCPENTLVLPLAKQLPVSVPYIVNKSHVGLHYEQELEHVHGRYLGRAQKTVVHDVTPQAVSVREEPHAHVSRNHPMGHGFPAGLDGNVSLAKVGGKEAAGVLSSNATTEFVSVTIVGVESSFAIVFERQNFSRR